MTKQKATILDYSTPQRQRVGQSRFGKLSNAIAVISPLCLSLQFVRSEELRVLAYDVFCIACPIGFACGIGGLLPPKHLLGLAIIGTIANGCLLVLDVCFAVQFFWF